MLDFNFQHYNPRNFLYQTKIAKKTTLIVLLFLLMFSVLLVIALPPKNFPVGVIVKIEKGDNVNKISENLKNKNIIQSELLFKILTKISGKEEKIIAGDYFFENPRSVFSIIERMGNGDFGLTPIKITLYEGLTAREMAKILERKLSNFDEKKFIKLADENKKEGFLFPDTYLFLPNVKTEDVIEAMEQNFYKKTKEIQSQIKNSQKSLREILTMASILEEEAKTFKSRRIISGILWKRIEIGMPLQVDAVFPYIIEKNTYQLTLEDLKTDSPYNTYRYKGLPPGPISNPGLSSILATLEPIESDYLFYLSDREGNMYYATNFDEHKKNKELYMN